MCSHHHVRLVLGHTALHCLLPYYITCCIRPGVLVLASRRWWGLRWICWPIISIWATDRDAFLYRWTSLWPKEAIAVYSGGFNGLTSADRRDLISTYAGVLELTFGFIATSLAGSTRLLNRFSCGRKANIGAIPGAGKTITTPQEDTTTAIKLSPIICNQKSLGTTQSNLTLPAPNNRANRFSWSRSPEPLIGTSPGHGSIILLIDDVSDDEGEALQTKQDAKLPYSNVWSKLISRPFFFFFLSISPFSLQIRTQPFFSGITLSHYWSYDLILRSPSYNANLLRRATKSQSKPQGA